MQIKKYEFFEHYFNLLRTDLKVENTLLITMKAFFFHFLSLALTVYITVHIKDKELTTDFFIGLLIILTIYIVLYFIVFQTGLIKSLIYSDYDDYDGYELNEATFNQMINTLVAACEFMENDQRDNAVNSLSDFDEIQKSKQELYLQEIIHYVYMVSLQINKSVKTYKENIDISEERYRALYQLLVEVINLLCKRNLIDEKFWKQIKKLQEDTEQYI